MSKSLYNVSLLDILPPNLKVSPKQRALAKAFDTAFRLYAQNIKRVIIFADIKPLSDDILDILAVEMRVNGYSKNYPKETKIALIKSNYFVWHTKGTPKAVEKIVENIFSDGYVEEWFDYGGEPYHFKVHTSNISATDNMVKNFEIAVKNTQNIRSHLESLIVEASTNLDLNVGMYIQEAEFFEF